MPLDELHKKKKYKNLMILAIVIGWAALIWAITMIKMANGG